jgi:molybdopterin/thiamine biosynthesis adenylyltransferase
MHDLRITIPVSDFESALPQLLEGRGEIDITGALDEFAGTQFIATRISPPRPVIARLSLRERFVHPTMAGVPPDTRIILQIGRGARLGRARAWIRMNEGWIRARDLFLAGPRMIRLALTPAVEPDSPDDAPWAATRGALGASAHSALRSLHVGIVGLGRLGCVLARNLAGLGVAGMAIVDPDKVELRNTGEGGFFGPDDVGQHKVHAWENWLAVRHSAMEVTAIPASISTAKAEFAIAACDLLVAAADNPAARILVASTAAAFGRPLLDVGTQILIAGGTSGAGPTMGLDVRYIFPGRCLLCFGGAGPDEALARRVIASPDFEQQYFATRDGLAERVGSLDSLNNIAAAHATRMVEDGLIGRLAGDTWRREEFLPDGHSQSTYLSPGRGFLPCFCRFAGWGVAAAPLVLPILEERARGVVGR